MKKNDNTEKKKSCQYDTKVANLPRGIRNNNPLNIRIGNNWLGEKVPNTDGTFEQFVSMPYGIRAALKIIYNYMTKYNLKTIAKIISRWAPRNENNTARYIKYVSKRMDTDPNEELYFTYTEMRNLLLAMAKIECGYEIATEAFREGWDLYESPYIPPQ